MRRARRITRADMHAAYEGYSRDISLGLIRLNKGGYMLHVKHGDGEYILAWDGEGYKDKAGHPWKVDLNSGIAGSVDHTYHGPFTVVPLELEDDKGSRKR